MYTDLLIPLFVLGVKAVGNYWPRPTEWPNGTRSDVLYATENSEMPPVLVEVQNVVDEKFIHRVVRYCEEVFCKYGTPPVVIIIAVNDCKNQVANRATKNKKTPFFLKLQSYPWAQKCLLLNKESISPYLNKTPLDPVVALGSFFVEQKQSIKDHPYCEDAFVQLLYSKAHHIFQNQVAVDDTKISFLLRAVDDAEFRYNKAIEMLENDEENERAKKRTISHLRESMEVLKACKRQCVASGSSTPSQSPYHPRGNQEARHQPTVFKNLPLKCQLLQQSRHHHLLKSAKIGSSSRPIWNKLATTR